MVAEVTPEYCPCGSGETYSACCRRYHQGEPAPTPELLMRSRFSAFVLKLSGYLVDTWHGSTRPQNLDLTDSPRWTSLQILSSDNSGSEGCVHFRAIYQVGPGWGYLEEKSAFVQEDGRWYYVNGKTSEGLLKPGRNDPCPCGSGKKYKTCCL